MGNGRVPTELTADGHACVLDGGQFMTRRRNAAKDLLSLLLINFLGAHGKLYLLSPQSVRNETVTCPCISIKERGATERAPN